MNIRLRLTIQYVLTVAFLLLVFSVLIYLFSSIYRHEEFSSRLENKAKILNKYIIDTPHLNFANLKPEDIDSVNVIPFERIKIFSDDLSLLFCSQNDYKNTIPESIFEKIKTEKEFDFEFNERESFGLYTTTPYGKYIIIISAYDMYGYSKLYYLFWMLLFLFIFGICTTFLLGMYFSKKALSPIIEVVSQVENITINNISDRVDEGNGKDEIAKLAIEFNKMLSRLEQSFKTQKNFVSNASHELRTPLTKITGQLQVSLMDENISTTEREILKDILSDVKSLNKLTNGLLELAQNNADMKKIAKSAIRIDELTANIIADLKKSNKNYIIDFNIEKYPSSEQEISFMGNDEFTTAIIRNIIDNACKYSPDSKATINVLLSNNTIILKIHDNGIGIDENDYESIFIPFYRGSNAKNTKGHGIGLALVYNFCKMQDIQISFESTLHSGTCFTLIFKALPPTTKI